MKEIIKDHPLRPIILRFDTSRSMPEFERKGLEAYYSLHDETWELKSKLLKQEAQLKDILSLVDELTLGLYAMEQDLDFLEAALEIGEEHFLPMVEGTFTIDYTKLHEALNGHVDNMEKLYPKIKAAWDWYQQHADFVYEYETAVDFGHDELIHALYSRYEEVSVDIVSLDRDQQEFFGAYAEVDRLQSDYFDHAEQVLDMYDALHELTDGIYRRVEIVDEVMEERFGG